MAGHEGAAPSTLDLESSGYSGRWPIVQNTKCTIPTKDNAQYTKYNSYNVDILFFPNVIELAASMGFEPMYSDRQADVLDQTERWGHII